MKQSSPSADGPELLESLRLPAETVARLGRHLELLRTWQRRINLVGEGTLGEAWRRHVLDSAQLAPHLPPGGGRIADLGSGAGFPGLVLAIVTGREIDLVESDARKAAFLREAARICAASAVVHNRRSEALPPLQARVVTARALAPLARLVELAAPHLAPEGCCLFLKGRTWEQELTDSCKDWMISTETFPSASDPSGVILKAWGITRRHGRTGQS